MKRQVTLVGKALLYALGGLALLVTVAFLIGGVLPVEHTATASRLLPAEPAVVWGLVTTPSDFSSWRPGVTVVEVSGRPGPSFAWTEEGSGGVLPMEITDWDPPAGMRVRIASDDLPFGGVWTYRLDPEPGATRLTLTEDGEVYNPLFRFVSKFVIGHDTEMVRYLDALEAHLQAAGS